MVEKIGAATEYGKIGANVAAVVDSPTPLQKQTDSLVKLCAGIAAVLFLLVSTFTYFNVLNQPFNDRIIESILSGITLAMAMISGDNGITASSITKQIGMPNSDLVYADQRFSKTFSINRGTIVADDGNCHFIGNLV